MTSSSAEERIPIVIGQSVIDFWEAESKKQSVTSNGDNNDSTGSDVTLLRFVSRLRNGAVLDGGTIRCRKSKSQDGTVANISCYSDESPPPSKKKRNKLSFVGSVDEQSARDWKNFVLSWDPDHRCYRLSKPTRVVCTIKPKVRAGTSSNTIVAKKALEAPAPAPSKRAAETTVRPSPSPSVLGDLSVVPPKTMFVRMKVAALRNELQLRGKDTSGKKAILINRLLDTLHAEITASKSSDSLPDVNATK